MTCALAEVHALWPRQLLTRQWRGAVIAQMAAVLPEHALWPWTQRTADGTCVQAPPRVYYRTTDSGPQVFSWGAGARQRIEDLAYHLDCVRLPDGEPIPVRGVTTRVWEDVVAISRERWHRYELATPYWPSEVVEARRPRRGEPWQDRAWASYALASSVRTLLGAIGMSEVPAHPLHVEVSGELRFGRVEWERPVRGQGATRNGFTCGFVTNAELPDGFVLGGKGSEGFGEVRRCH